MAQTGNHLQARAGNGRGGRFAMRQGDKRIGIAVKNEGRERQRRQAIGPPRRGEDGCQLASAPGWICLPLKGRTSAPPDARLVHGKATAQDVSSSDAALCCLFPVSWRGAEQNAYCLGIGRR